MFYINESLYRKLYLKLFNEVTDALELLQQARCAEAKALLIKAQQDCEELYINHGEEK